MGGAGMLSLTNAAWVVDGIPRIQVPRRQAVRIRMIHLPFGALLLGAVVSMGASQRAGAQSYTAVNLGSLGGRNTIGYAINASGQVAGSGDVAGGYYHAFMSDGSSLTDLGTLAGTVDSNSNGSAINASGQVAGDSGYPGAPNIAASHAYISKRGALIDLGSLGGAIVSVAAVNDAGEVAGWS